MSRRDERRGTDADRAVDAVPDLRVVVASAGRRRTRRSLLAEVRREVEAMELLALEGPASLLRERLAARGVRTTLETLRSGDCRPLLERVWRRRARSRARFGPTNGHDLRRHADLVDDVIDLTASVARVRADIAGRVVQQAATTRDPRSLAVCRHHADHVRSMAELIGTVVAELGASGVHPDFTRVSEALAARGRPLSVRSIRRREEYWRPVFEYVDIEKPRKPHDPARTALSLLCRERLGAMVVRLQAELAKANAEFEATLG